ncbi:flavodoxin domain-containing protein [Xylanimonas protaetiae]|uniref:flavodoxin domain-containing protein n=1 Tax=Xylanimonas protaetiae TaxID=2509457 RepID=UPI0013E9FC04|nr:flavodoxin domain-containing protein [Xylanimonas protaetiae]
MRAAVVVASKHGTTLEIGRRVARALGADVPVLDLAEDQHPDLAAYDTVVLGTAIYAGQPRAHMKAFAQIADLDEKRLGLFVSGMVPADGAREEELAAAYPPALRDRATAAAFLGGSFQFDKLNRFERFVVKRVAKATADVDAIDDRAIDRFARELVAA